MNPHKHATENFAKGFAKLEGFMKTPVVDERDKASIIQAFEYTFELSWKTIQKMVIAHSKSVGSPKQAFQAAFELGWIKESQQQQWLQMIDDRNATSHTYKEQLADEILGRIRSQHVQLLQGLLAILQGQR